MTELKTAEPNLIPASEVQSWQQQLLHRALQVLVVIGGVALILGSITAYTSGTAWLIVFYLLLYAGLLVITFWKRVSYNVQAWTLIVLMYGLGLSDFFKAGLSEDARVFLLLVPFLAVLLFGLRGGLIALGFCVLAHIAFAAAFMLGVIRLPVEAQANTSNLTVWASVSLIFLGLGLLIVLAQNYLMRHLAAALEQSRTLTSELQSRQVELEKRIAAHTKMIETSAEVSRSLSTILDPQQLVLEVVEQIQRAFGYYHVHIYLLDDKKENLVLAGGTGEAGRIMLARHHKISWGKGLVGEAAETNRVVLVSNVLMAEAWLPNPLLPDTQAEVAIPIAVGGRVLGVLDVQNNAVNSLQTEDADLLLSVARQVGIALQNSRFYTQTLRQAQREVLINNIGQKIQGATTVEDVLQVAVRELGEALNAQRASVQLHLSANPTEQRQ